MKDMSHADCNVPASIDVPTLEECTDDYGDTSVSVPFSACAFSFSLAPGRDLSQLWVVDLACSISTVVYLRNRAFSRAVCPSGGVPLTLLTSATPDASKFCVFGCTVFAKVPDKLRRNLSEKAFRGVMAGYPSDAPGYRVYNLVTRHITTSVHVVFQEDTLGFTTSMSIDSVISDASDTMSLTSHTSR
jgi:hypothetical protein